MLATSDLWFRYQDEPVLKGLNLDFFAFACYRFGGRERLWEVYAFMNLSGLLRPQKGPCCGRKTAGLQQARTTGAAPASCDGFFRTLNSRFFYTDIDSDIAFSLRNLGCRRRKSRAASTRR